MIRSFESALRKKIRSGVPDLKSVTPGMVIDVYKKGEPLVHLRMGRTYHYYDLASLTKILFTATAWMRWVAKSDFNLKLPAYYFLTWWRHKEVQVRSLLTHSAGLSWWRPYYTFLRGTHDFESRWPQMIEHLKRGRPHPGTKAVYSDLDLFMLGFLLEEMEQKSLPEIWSDVRHALGLEHTDFNAGNKPRHARRLYAPTEDCPWRGHVMQGEVHDENTWALGGVAPHAGLFAPPHDVSKWALTLRKALRGETHLFGSQKVVEAFTERQLSKARGDWGYLFMKPSAKGSSCGRHFSRQSFGHTGFTGTSIWMDPVRDLIVVILSNRVHPTRQNSAFVQLRPRIHDWICELL